MSRVLRRGGRGRSGGPPADATAADAAATSGTLGTLAAADEAAPVRLPRPAEAADATLSESDAPTRAIELSEGPPVPSDPGLYAVLGLDPSAADSEIQTAYRRQAARLVGGGGRSSAALRQLNVAYEVLGNPFRRAEYDRLRATYAGALGEPLPVRADAKVPGRLTRRRRPRHVVQPRYPGSGEVLVVLVVVGLAVLFGVLLIPRLSVNLSALNVLGNVLPTSTRRVIDPNAAPAATPTATPLPPTPTVRPGLSEHFAGSSASVSNPTPAQNTSESVVVKLRRDGQPATNVDLWSSVHYRTTNERWPPSGTVRTDATGTATITFNIGDATLNYPVQVQVFAQVEDQQLTWTTSFTPH